MVVTENFSNKIFLNSWKILETTGYSQRPNLTPESENETKIKQANNQFECGVSSGYTTVLLDTLQVTTYPWFALLEYKFIGSFRQIRCAGVIIDDRHVLTSASCAPNDLVSVRYGQWSPNCTKDDLIYLCANPTESAGVSDVHFHPRFVQQAGLYKKDNVAVIRLAKRLEFNEYVRPICLNHVENGFDISTKQFFYPQWNLKVDQLSSSPPESFVKRSTVENIDTCNDAHGNALTSFKDSVVCVSPGCVFAGGPLVHVEFGPNGTRKVYVVGVGSFATTQCQVDGERWADIYSKVSSYSDWIQEYTSQ